MFAVKFFCSGLFIVIHLIKSEVFPTTVRQISLGSCSVAMRIGSVVAPYSRELVNKTFLEKSSLFQSVLILISGKFDSFIAVNWTVWHISSY